MHFGSTNVSSSSNCKRRQEYLHEKLIVQTCKISLFPACHESIIYICVLITVCHFLANVEQLWTIVSATTTQMRKC